MSTISIGPKFMASVLAERRLIRLIFDDNSSEGLNFHENNITQSSSQMAGSRRNDNKRDFPPATKKSHLKYAHHKASRTSSIATCVSFSVFLSRAQLLRSPESRQTSLHFYSASLSSAYASPPQPLLTHFACDMNA